MPIKRVITKGKVPVKINTDEIEHAALNQLANIAQLPFVHSHIAAMPDVYYGMGATVGSVIPALGAIIPEAVGVDIGCGMNAVRLSLTTSQLPDKCDHNYVSVENHFASNVFITRKGAINAELGELGIIPGSMGTKSYIVRGKGNPTSFCSCSHEAERRTSRGKAKRLLSTEDMKSQTEGIDCRKDKGVIDEITVAHKDIDMVMENQTDLVEIVHTLKQAVCVKG